MVIIAVDDEKIALERLISVIKEVENNADIIGFRNPLDVVEYAKNKLIDIAFLDIEMRVMIGITLAKQLKIINPKINIIFTTGYSEYATDAFSMHASGYVLKPITKEKISVEINELWRPIKNQISAPVQVFTFGNFEVYVNGKPVEFQYNKSKELFAYLIDRQGSLCTNNELMAILWEDEVKESYFRNVRVDLLKSLPNDIFQRQWGKLGIKKDKISCDYYDWLNGVPSAINSYNGEYMTQYSWSEMTLGNMKNI